MSVDPLSKLLMDPGKGLVTLESVSWPETHHRDRQANNLSKQKVGCDVHAYLRPNFLSRGKKK